MEDGRYVSWKFVPLGKSAKVSATITKGTVKDKNKIIFKNANGSQYNYKYNSNTESYELRLPASKSHDGYELYALLNGTYY